MNKSPFGHYALNAESTRTNLAILTTARLDKSMQ